MKYMPNWVIESWKIGDETNLGDVGVMIDGEFAAVVSMNCILTDSDHTKLRELDKKHATEYKAYFAEYTGLFKKKDKGNAMYSGLLKRHSVERQAVYARGEPFIDGHRFIVAGAPYAYELLCKYRDTGVLDKSELSRVLNIMEGKDAPIVPRVEKDYSEYWKALLSA